MLRIPSAKRMCCSCSLISISWLFLHPSLQHDTQGLLGVQEARMPQSIVQSMSPLAQLPTHFQIQCLLVYTTSTKQFKQIPRAEKSPPSLLPLLNHCGHPQSSNPAVSAFLWLKAFFFSFQLEIIGLGDHIKPPKCRKSPERRVRRWRFKT